MDVTEMARRRQLLDQLRRVLPHSQPWEEWLDHTGELPPDFGRLPSIPDLPDLLRMTDGSPVQTADQWASRQQELRDLIQHWVFGRVPPRPESLQMTVEREEADGSSHTRRVRLSFGPGNTANLGLTLYIPSGTGPFPVFLTQSNHVGWAMVALQRGYVGCVYSGSDDSDDTDTFLGAYPEYDWSRLARRAWAGSRCLDYLESLPFVRANQVAITGHSRNGKQSLFASAMDERIALVISSSSGAGGSIPSRYSSEPQFNEGIEQITRTFPDWFHPRYRFFSGRDDRMPVDMHTLVALSAPRPCLLSIALNDGVENEWAMEKMYLAVQHVYRMLGVEDRLRILHRSGSHETSAFIAERYLDWCDHWFGRPPYPRICVVNGGEAPPCPPILGDTSPCPPMPGDGSSCPSLQARTASFPAVFAERLLFPHGRQEAPMAGLGGAKPESPSRPEPLTEDVPIDGGISTPSTLEGWKSQKNKIQIAVREMLGEFPTIGVEGQARSYGAEPGHVAALLGRGSAREGIEKTGLEFGDYLSGDVYTPNGLKSSGGKAPAVLWLHPLCTSHGYVAWYWRDGAGGGGQVFHALARAGMAVFCFDQIGCGRRIEEIEGFYQRYPHGSLLGKMVHDSRAALKVLQSLPFVDAENTWVLGYSLGAMVGLHLATLEDSIAGLVSVCGPPSFAGAGSPPDCISRWTERLPLLPGLASTDPPPYDIKDLLACAAPSPTLVVSPQLDREAPFEGVCRVVQDARAIYELYGAGSHLEQYSPEDFNQFGTSLQHYVVNWLRTKTSIS